VYPLIAIRLSNKPGQRRHSSEIDARLHHMVGKVDDPGRPTELKPAEILLAELASVEEQHSRAALVPRCLAGRRDRLARY
jgi:hypothetical protein